jgi:hypothetical protein
MASSEVFAAMTAFLDRLEKASIHYSLAYSRQDAVMVQIAVPGERWEVEFMGDGTIDVEKFKSDGTIVDGAALDELFALFSD